MCWVKNIKFFSEMDILKMVTDNAGKLEEVKKLAAQYGIKEEDLPRLFEAYQRIEEGRNRNIEGTGLGMNITLQLLSMMGSRLEVKSVYGEGSEFSFNVTQKVVSWEQIGDFEEALQRAKASRKRYRESFTAPEAAVLVVDDTPMNLTVIQGLLKRTKLRVVTAERGEEAIKLTK